MSAYIQDKEILNKNCTKSFARIPTKQNRFYPVMSILKSVQNSGKSFLRSLYIMFYSASNHSEIHD